ncbi:MAG: hypothetical protein FJW39_19265 [Acidobacteria bacterium]|nr:hypothetical protein [Acidobacteriota bacterium]
MRIAIMAALCWSTAPAEPLEEGLALLSRLRCINCHASPDLETVAATPLDGAANRLRASYVSSMLRTHYIADPNAMAMLGSRYQTSPAIVGAAEPGPGQKLVEQVGCNACHGLTLTEGSRSGRYQPGMLAVYLQSPLHQPRIPLTGSEAASIAAYLDPSVGPAEAWPSAGRAASSACVNCHGFTGAATVPAPPLAAVARRPGTKCSTARYNLSATESRLVRTALDAIRDGHRVSPEQSLRLRLEVRQCHACHNRDGRGPAPEALARFTVTEDTDLGDEGRIPPAITRIGYKLTQPALVKALRGDTRVHPRMAARMPDFGEAAALDLARRLAEADTPAGLKPIERVGRNTFGRELAGIRGLGCINCHELRGRKSLGIGASDLALAPQRLRAEWFRDFLIDPARFHPGTRMPSFWPGGVASNKKVLRGDTARQIDGIWVYLMESGQTRLPEGMEDRGSFEIKPTDKVIVFRTFIKGAGTHGIAVGYPEKVHAAFDAQEVRWALVWRGRFLDAEATWEDRFNPPSAPLGADVLSLPAGPEFTVEGGADAARFRGYRLDARGTPTFLYSIGGAEIEDRLTPSRNGFTRTISIRNAPANVWRRKGGERVRVAPGSSEIREEITW